MSKSNEHIKDSSHNNVKYEKLKLKNKVNKDMKIIYCLQRKMIMIE